MKSIPLELNDETKGHIQRLEEMMYAYEQNQHPQDKDYYDALAAGVKALENQGCGCILCLTHNAMKCPRMANE